MPAQPHADGAVFLSYASQDAEAAKRIADVLRAAGVEVWFDQSELVGGDAWDAKIRKQIAECALFVPLISANTQARLEGYFRIEWKLAAQRTYAMADAKPFLLPVLIDGTRDAEAHVPAEFRAVQWTKLPHGEAPPAFVARVRKLLGGEAVGGALRPDSAEPSGRKVRPTVRASRPWLLLAILGMCALVGLALWQRWKIDPPGRSDTNPLAAVSAPVSEARKLTNQAMLLLEDPNFTRETSWLADELCQRALALDAGDAEVWAVAALASNNLYSNTYDTSAGRREKARSQAARASQLDPQSVRAALAVARCLEDDGEKMRMLRELHRRAPGDQQVIFSLIVAEGKQENNDAVQDLLRELRALPRTGLLSLSLWFRELRLRISGRYAEAEAILDEMLSGPVVLRGAYYEKLQLLLRSWHELAAAGPFIEKIPARFRQEPAFGSAIAYYWLWRAEPEKALQALAQVPQDYFEEYAAHEPKGYLTGWAHTIAGRPAAAQAEWRNALALVEERMKTDSRNYALLDQRALLLALTGQREAAREAWQLRVELGGEQDRPGFDTEAQVLLARHEPEAALTALEQGWAKRSPGSRGWALPNLRYHPAFAEIRGDPRMQRILADGETMLRNLKTQQTRAPKSDLTDLSEKVDDKSVAVLAFANLSDDKGNEYFSDGISEELLNVLAKVPGLKVTARTSSFHFKGKDTPIPEIAQQLGVAYVVEGSVRKAGDKVRITAQLIKAADGFHVWSDTFTRDLKDIFAVQDEIAGLIAKQLQLNLGTTERTKKTVDPEAYRLVLEGRYFWLQRTEVGLAHAEASYMKALEYDPQFAQAHAGLGDVWSIRAWYKLLGGNRQVAEDLARAGSEARLAIQLDPNLAEAYATLGAVLFNQRKFSEADQQYQASLRLNPNYGFAHHWYAQMLFTQGKPKEALVEMDRAVSCDPLAFITLASYAVFLSNIGQTEKALAMNDRAIALRPDMFVPAQAQRANILFNLGRKEEALTVARAVVRNDAVQPRWWMDGIVIQVLREAGQTQEAEAYAARLLHSLPADNMNRGYVLAGVGRSKEAMREVLATGLDSSMIFTFIYDHFWDEVRKDPRLPELLTQLKIAEEYWRGREALEQLKREQMAKK